MRIAGALLVWLAVLLVPYRLQAQEDGNLLLLRFDRQNDFTYSTFLDWGYRFEKGRYSLDARLGHSNILNSSLKDQPFVQVYLRSSIWQHYRLRPRLDLASWVETDQYFNSRNEKVNLYAGVRYRPTKGIFVTPLIGYTWDTRTAILGQSEASPRLDQGFTPAVRMEANVELPQEVFLRAGGFLRYKFIEPRRQHNVELYNYWSKRFEEGVAIQVGARLGSHELDDYQGNSVKRIISDSLMPQLNLSYEFMPGLEWRSENDMVLYRRFFRFQNLLGPEAEENDLTFDGLEVYSRQRVTFTKGKWRTYGVYEFNFTSRKYDLENNTNQNQAAFETRLEQEKQKDFVRNFHKVELFVNRKIGRRHQITGTYVNQYLQFDTPSEANFDDRDELSHLGSLSFRNRWLRNFSTEWGLSANYRHYAFLLAEKSQDNYIQRSLRMDFGFDWEFARKWRLEGNQAVYVTYNVKDFTDYNKTDRSTRNLESNFKLYFRPGRRMEAEAGFRRKETHQSYLNWEEFSETTLDSIVILTGENKYRWYMDIQQKKAQAYLDLGYRHFEQTKKFKATMNGLDNSLKTISLKQINRQTGPLTALGYRHPQGSTVDLSCWLQFQVRQNKYNVLDNGPIFGTAFNEAELKEVRTDVRPYVSIRVNYLFK